MNLEKFHINNQGISELVSQLPELTHLRLGRYNKVTHKGIEKLALGLPKLTYLDLSGCETIDNTDIYTIVRNLKHLTYLDISWCSLISDSGLNAIVKLDKLTHLILKGCEKITSVGFLNTPPVALLPNLIYLDISSCSKINNNAIHTISTGLPNLKTLIMGVSPLVDINGYQAIANYLSKLSHLDISYNYKVDASIIETLGRKLNLTHLKISSCNAIKTDSLKAIAIIIPSYIS